MGTEGTTGGDTVAVPVGIKGGEEISWKIGIFQLKSVL